MRLMVGILSRFVQAGDRNPFFGNVNSSQVQLNPIGEIAQNFWADIPNHFDYTYIHTYVIMPNHIHGIIIIDCPNPIKENIPPNNVETLHCNVSTKSDITQRQLMSDISPKVGSLSAIVRSYKSAVTRQCRRNGYDSFAWQPRFYEHIIRADSSLDRIRQYIINNPAQWEADKNNPTNLWM